MIIMVVISIIIQLFKQCGAWQQWRLIDDDEDDKIHNVQDNTRLE